MTPCYSAPALNTKTSILQKADAASIGLEMGGYVIAGYLLGSWLDGLAGTTPWLTTLYLVLGLFAAARSVWRVTMSWRRNLRAEAQADVHVARPLVSGRWHGGGYR